MRKNILWIGLAVLILTVITSGCGNQAEQDSLDSDNGKPPYLTIATGGTSGPYFTIGGALAKIYKQKLNYNAAVRSSDGSVENVNLLKSKQADLAFAMSDVVSFAMESEESFQSNDSAQPFKAIAGLYLNYVQIVTLKDRDIQSVSDLMGKRVGVGAPDSGVEVNARMILEEHDITYQDIKPEYLSYDEAIEQLKNNSIDAAFVTSGLPNAAVLDLQGSNEVKIVSIEPSVIEHLTKQFPFFVKAELPPGIYDNELPVPTVAIRNILLVRSDLTEEQVYQITKAFFENLHLLQGFHEAAKEINPKEAGENLVVPLHPGAEKYYEEMSVP